MIAYPQSSTHMLSSTRVRLSVFFLSVFCVALVDECLAHTGERAFILLLPTKQYIIGGALVVGLSFVIAIYCPVDKLARIESARISIPIQCPTPGLWPSWLVLFIYIILVVAGFIGSRDPLANPLPVVVWSAWWVGFTFLTALIGNLWSLLNPWRSAYELITRLPGMQHVVSRIQYPVGLSYWPAVVLFFGFVWFELIYPAPQDPAILAKVILGYSVVTFLAMLLFGKQAWLRYGECFSVFFRMVSWLSPTRLNRGLNVCAPSQHNKFAITYPGARLMSMEKLPVSMVAFILLVLTAVSFDGLSRSFWWMGVIGENPLEYPGRTTLMMVNTIGLIATFFLFTFAYLATLLISRRLGGADIGKTAGVFILAIVPIAFGYHFAHYLPSFLVDFQYALKAVSDPFSLGWNLFGSRDLHVTASFLTHHRSVEVIWNVQILAIVIAHVMAVVIAHVLTLRTETNRRLIILSQIPATVLMIGYTLFGLWLLSSPAVG